MAGLVCTLTPDKGCMIVLCSIKTEDGELVARFIDETFGVIKNSNGTYSLTTRCGFIRIDEVLVDASLVREDLCETYFSVRRS